MKLTIIRSPIAQLSIMLALTGAVALRAEILEQILVKVNGDIVTKTEFEFRQIQTLRLRNIPNNDPNSEELKRAIAEITPQMILDSVDELLIMQRGKELGYKLGDTQFDEIVAKIKEENKLENEEQFQAALKQENLTMADLRRSMEKQMVMNRVQQAEVNNKISTTEDEERAYYQAHKDEFSTPSEITLREILIEVPDDGKGINVGLDDEAKQKAEDLRGRILAGESFEKVAAEHSNAPSRANGGLIGPIKRNEVAPAFQEIINPLKVGEISPVARTKRGYQFLKLESATDTTLMPFDQAREQIAERLFNLKRRGELVKYLNKLRGQAIIEWKNDQLKQAYDQALAEVLKSVATQGTGTAP